MLAASLLLGSACGTPLDLGFAIAVTVRFDDAIDAGQRSSVRSLFVASTGDERAEYTEPLPDGARPVEAFVYRPATDTRALELTLTARDASALVAEGTTGLLALSAGKTTRVEVLLRAAAADSDLGLDGGSPADGALGPVSTLAFQHAELYPTGAGARDTAVADFNSDGHFDVGVACLTANVVQVFFGKPDGSLPSSPSAVTTVISPTGLAALDFDQDAKIDLVVVNSDGAHLLKNDGTGHFMDVATRALTGAVKVSTADFDKDGYVDLLASGSATEVRILWGSSVAATAFTTSTVLTIAGAPGQTLAVDLDNDGYLDVVVLETAAGKIESLRNTHATTARSFSPATALATYPNPYSAVFQDINNDGKPEALYASGAGGGYAFALLTNTNGVLGLAGNYSLYNRNVLATHDMRLVDIDHDGISDLVVADALGWYVNTFKGLGPLQFETSANQVYWAGGRLGPLQAADFDKDGYEDLLLLDGDGLSVARGGAGAKLAAAEVISFLQSDYVVPLVLATDFDKDGDQELVLLDRNSKTVFVYANDGKGKLAATASLPPGAGTLNCGYGASIALGDLDNDGHTDILRVWDSCYDVVRGLGNGTLEQGAIVTSAVGGGALVRAGIADLDEDGKTDLVFTNYGAGAVTVSLGLGNGTFSSPTTLFVYQAQTLLLVDVNGDAHIDLVVTGGDNKISTFLNDGHAVFGEPTTVSGPGALVDIAVFDYDDDKIVDLVAAGDALVQFKGGPGFSDFKRGSKSLTSPWKHLSVGDFNRDGKVDLVAGTPFGIEIALGSGTGVFSTAHAFNFVAGLGQIGVADFDGDKLPDVFVVAGSNEVGAAVLRNLSK